MRRFAWLGVVALVAAACGEAAVVDDPVLKINEALVRVDEAIALAEQTAEKADERAAEALVLAEEAMAVAEKAAEGGAGAEGEAAAEGGHEAAAEPGEPPHWAYTGDVGPEFWGSLSAEFATCSSGTAQSPIDLAAPSLIGLSNLEFNYGPTAGTVVNNGHTIQVNLQPGNEVVLDGKTYGLAQFHFHLPSEHTVDGSPAPLEVHLVHKDASGNLAVVGVFIEEGASNAALTPVWGNIPATAGGESPLAAKFNPTTLLPGDRQVWRYDGSLTTPPCSEGVEWNVMHGAIALSSEQIAQFASLYSGNARPVQPLGSRTLLQDSD
jgi:carbonic anhydrase